MSLAFGRIPRPNLAFRIFCAMVTAPRLCLPRWEDDRLQEMYCTACAWSFPIDPAEAELPSRHTAIRLALEFEAHECSAYGVREAQHR